MLCSSISLPFWAECADLLVVDYSPSLCAAVIQEAFISRALTEGCHHWVVEVKLFQYLMGYQAMLSRCSEDWGANISLEPRLCHCCLISSGWDVEKRTRMRAWGIPAVLCCGVGLLCVADRGQHLPAAGRVQIVC